MGNTGIQGINVKDKYVRMKDENFEEGTVLKNKIFFCEDGFGCHPHTIGSKVFAYQVATGIRGMVRRHDIERLATEEEIELAGGKAG